MVLSSENLYCPPGRSGQESGCPMTFRIRCLELVLAGVLVFSPCFVDKATADTIVRGDGRHTVKSIIGGTAPLLGGTVSLLDAFVNTGGGTDFDSLAGTYPYTALFPVSTRVVTSTGPRYTATAQATINVNLTSWTSKGSFARRTRTGTAVDTYLSKFIVNDPMHIDLFTIDIPLLEFNLNLGKEWDMLIDPDADEVWFASLSGYDETSFNGLGRLWDYSWTVDSSDPTNAVFAFASNPALGLDDSLIESIFAGLASYDSSTGLHSLSADFSVSATVAAASGQADFFFGGADVGEIRGTVPEPASFLLFSTGLIGLVAVRFLERRRGERGVTA